MHFNGVPFALDGLQVGESISKPIEPIKIDGRLATLNYGIKRDIHKFLKENQEYKYLKTDNAILPVMIDERTGKEYKYANRNRPQRRGCSRTGLDDGSFCGCGDRDY